MAYKTLTQNQLFDRISDSLAASTSTRPPFTLIMGSGFSYGVIPTTSEIVEKDLSWWKWCKESKDNGPTLEDYRTRKENYYEAEANDRAREFWKRVYDAQEPTTKDKFDLGSNGLPTRETIQQAYCCALSPHCGPGLNTPGNVRSYFGDIIRRAGNRLNPAHLYLASIIAETKARRLFGTIFTTNFDPLLQRSLQLVNAPYFVSDRPETLEWPDDDDAINEVVHIIHAHGSIYRYRLLNSPDEIQRFAAENQNKLHEYFRKHAVLIVGSSGWDDAITQALNSVSQFDHNLYWCDRNGDLDKSGLTLAAREILSKHDNAFYVQIKDADDLMVQMHQHLLGHALPRIFREPILSARDQLDLCDLSEVKLPRKPDAPGSTETDGKFTGFSSRTEDVDLGHEILAVRRRLDDAQNLFIGKTPTDYASMLAAQARQELAVASDLYLSGKYEDAVPHFNFAIEKAEQLDSNELGLGDLALARMRRGLAYRQLGLLQDAITDFTFVTDMPDSSPKMRAQARVNRGVTYGQCGKLEAEIADYTAIIETRDTPTLQRVDAYFNRGVTYGQTGDLDAEITDFTAVIETPVAPVAQRAMAQINRGVAYGQRGCADSAIADFTAVIEMLDAPADMRASARMNRGAAYGQRDEDKDADRAITDFNSVIKMPDIPAQQRASVYINRGYAYFQRGQEGDMNRAASDFTAVLEMPEVGAEQHMIASAQLAALKQFKNE